MRYSGQSFGLEPGSDQITNAGIDGDRIPIDWSDEDGEAQLEVTSVDGVHYLGRFGYPVPDPVHQVEFTRFDAADGQVVLTGRWSNTATGARGEWLIRLSPTAKVVSKP